MKSITIIGFLAAFLTTAALIPQAMQTTRTRRTKDISMGMISALTAGILLWLIYGILLKDGPLMVANSISLVLSCYILIMKVKHG